MPIGAKVLKVEVQKQQTCLWALVDPKEKTTEMRRFKVYETGQEMPDDPYEYLGTIFFLLDNSLVYHVFEDRYQLAETKPV
jgi:hypothetical protein